MTTPATEPITLRNALRKALIEARSLDLKPSSRQNHADMVTGMAYMICLLFDLELYRYGPDMNLIRNTIMGRAAIEGTVSLLREEGKIP